MKRATYLAILGALAMTFACHPADEPPATLTRFDDGAAAGVRRADAQGRVAAASGPSAKLRIMETTDLHVNLESFNYYQNKPDLSIGLVRAGVLIRKARAEVANSLLIDNGDLIQGSPMGAWFHKTQDPAKQLHSVYKAMNLLGYDAANIGNHEFNFGIDFLEASLRGAAFPYVSANVNRVGSGKTPPTTLVPPYVLLKRKLVRDDGKTDTITIGVIGFAPPQIMTWDRSNLTGKLTADDIVDAANRYIPRMKAEGAELIIAVPHSGLSAAPRSGGDELAVNYLAQIPEIDAILAGHQHMVFPSPSFADQPAVDLGHGRLAGVPIAMAGAFGSHIGVIDLQLKKVAGRWEVASGESKTREVKSALAEGEFAADLRKALASDHAATIEYLSTPVGTTAVPIDSYWAQVAPSPVVEVVQRAMLSYMRRTLDRGGEATAALKDLPLLVASAPMKAGFKPDYYNNQPVGPLSLRNVAEFYIYPNTVRLVKITGAQLRDWLEMSAGAFHQVHPGRSGEQALLNPAFKAYNFDQILGVEYAIDATKPARFDPAGKLADPSAHRIVSLTYRGKAVTDEAPFLVITHNYRANGGGNFPHLNGQQVVLDPGKDCLEIVTEYVAASGKLTGLNTQYWRLLPVPNATLTFRSSPVAKQHLQTAPRPIVAMGLDADGFGRYRLK